MLVIRKQRLQAMLRGVVHRGTPKRAGGLEPPTFSLGNCTPEFEATPSGCMDRRGGRFARMHGFGWVSSIGYDTTFDELCNILYFSRNIHNESEEVR